MIDNKLMPELTLEPTPSPAAPAVPTTVEEPVKKEAEIILSPEEEKIIADFLPKINVVPFGMLVGILLAPAHGDINRCLCACGTDGLQLLLQKIEFQMGMHR